MTETNTLMTYGLLAVAAVALAVVAYTALGAAQAPTGAAWTPAQANQMFAAQDDNDKCTAPDGYSQADWERHMSHHPEMYTECF